MKMKWYFPLIMLLLAACDDEPKTSSGEKLNDEPALANINKEIEDNPDNASLYFERGAILDHLERDSLALIDYKKAISLDSTRAEYYSAIGDMLFENKDLDGSVQWIGKALELNPDDRKAHLKLAKMFLYVEEYNQALKEINNVLRQDVYDPEGYYLKGMVYKSLQDSGKSISSFLTALQVEPTYRDAMIQLGIMYGAQGDEKALKYYDNAFNMDTTDVFPLYARGVFYQDLENFELAKQEYINAIYKDRFYLNSYYNLGFIYLQQDSAQKAFRQYDILTKLDPQDPEAYFHRGLSYEAMGKTEEAIIDYKQALVFDETYQDPKERLKILGVK